MASLQFIGIESVVQAYEYKGVPVWAVFDGKTLHHKGTGPDDLQAYLEMIAQSESNATYILKVYEDLNDPKQVKERTEASGSFRFKLLENDFEGTKNLYRNLDRKIESIIDAKMGSIEPEETEINFIEIAKDYMQNPEKLVAVIGAIKNFFSPGQPAQPRAAVGAISPAETTAADLEKLQVAIDTLQKHDPQIIDHLVKLAGIAENNKATFNMLLGMLDKY